MFCPRQYVGATNTSQTYSKVSFCPDLEGLCGPKCWYITLISVHVHVQNMKVRFLKMFPPKRALSTQTQLIQPTCILDTCVPLGDWYWSMCPCASTPQINRPHWQNMQYECMWIQINLIHMQLQYKSSRVLGVRDISRHESVVTWLQFWSLEGPY